MGTAERIDFCQSLGPGTPNDLAALLRIVLDVGDVDTWSCCAVLIAVHLPCGEAVPFLIRMCNEAPHGKGGTSIRPWQ